jgi:hypothetical protein
MATRADVVGFGDTISLRAQFVDLSGVAADLDSGVYPQIKITQPSATTYLDYTSSGVSRISTGLYNFDLTIPNGPQGVWTDMWQGVVDGNTIIGTFNFVVLNQDVDTSLTTDGYEQLGDLPDFTFDQSSIHNLNILMNVLRKRLQSEGWHLATDIHGNQVRESCAIFSTQQLYAYLDASLGLFNEVPHFTNYTWDNDIVIYFRNIIIEGAYMYAVASQALSEKGREFNITDNGVNFQMPTVSDLLNSQFSTMYSAHMTNVKFIKASIKPAGIGLGTLSISGIAPQIARLRHVRSRRFW